VPNFIKCFADAEEYSDCFLASIDCFAYLLSKKHKIVCCTFLIPEARLLLDNNVVRFQKAVESFLNEPSTNLPWQLVRLIKRYFYGSLDIPSFLGIIVILASFHV